MGETRSRAKIKQCLTIEREGILYSYLHSSVIVTSTWSSYFV